MSHGTSLMDERAAKLARYCAEDPAPVLGETLELATISAVPCPNLNCGADGGARVTFRLDGRGGIITDIVSIDHRYGCGCIDHTADRLAYIAAYDTEVREAIAMAYGGDWTVRGAAYRDEDGYHSLNR
jgi:hypothetical protein